LLAYNWYGLYYHQRITTTITKDSPWNFLNVFQQKYRGTPRPSPQGPKPLSKAHPLNPFTAEGHWFKVENWNIDMKHTSGSARTTSSKTGPLVWTSWFLISVLLSFGKPTLWTKKSNQCYRYTGQSKSMSVKQMAW
jgi:hypothetical protein